MFAHSFFHTVISQLVTVDALLCVAAGTDAGACMANSLRRFCDEPSASELEAIRSRNVYVSYSGSGRHGNE